MVTSSTSDEKKRTSLEKKEKDEKKRTSLEKKEKEEKIDEKKKVK